MAISRKLRELLEKGDFDAIEDDWLAHLATDPGDLDHFVGIARAAVGQGEDERAQFLLEMLYEHLGEQQRLGRRLGLLRRAGTILEPDAEALHGRILDTLERLHGTRSIFTDLVEVVGLKRAPHDIPKTWDKVDRLESLLPFDIGEVVWMEGKGAGRVVELNLGLGSFRIDFERHPGLAVGVRAAAKVLTPLPPGHVLRRKLEEPEALRQLADDDPSALLAVVLKSYDGPRTAAEIRRALSGIVADSRWSSWWATARKHPQVVTDSSGRQSYSWAETSSDALQSVWQSFAAAEPRKQIDLLRRDGERDPQLKQRMQQALTTTAAKVAGEEPGLAVEIFYALEKGGGAPAGVDWAPAALLAPGGPTPLSVIAGIQDRAAREAAYDELRRQRQDWPQQFADALAREEDGRLLDRLGEALEEADPDALGRFFDGALSQPHKSPAAFTWLAERAAADEVLRRRNPLRLLQQILNALIRDELAPYRQRLLALAEHGGTLPRLLGDLDEQQAAAAENAIERAGALEPYQRDDLAKALHLRFPGLRRDDQALAPLYALPTSLAAKQAELARLLKEEIPANRRAIEEARAMGDLRENFEYKSARQRHEYLTARATELKDKLGRARPIDLANTDPGQVRVGTVVTLEGDGSRRRIALLGPWESEPDAGIISYESELGQALLEKKTGDTLEVAGASHTVAAIAVYAPDGS